jgi:putative phosphoesterase
MRIAIVSDIHGNLTAFEAVLADLRQTSPDLILQGGDLPHGGSAPAEIVDRIRDLGWPGVAGNTDEMLWKPESLKQFASGRPQLATMWTAIEETAVATRETLGPERIEWLSNLPLILTEGPLALVHASPDSTWTSPTQTATDAELEACYAPLGKSMVAFGHIHHSFIRTLPSGLTVINTGSVSLSYDGDPRAAYLLLDDGKPSIRRVEYDVDQEIQALLASRIPYADWIARTLRSAAPEML